MNDTTSGSGSELTTEVVTRWISGIDDATVDLVLDALRARNSELMAQRAEDAFEGAFITIRDVTPRFLDGLSGEIIESDGETVAVLLTTESTGRLRFSGQKVYDLGACKRFLLEGVPASCCYYEAESAASTAV